MATDKQKLVVAKTLENIGKGEGKSKGEILREVGYSEAIAKNPKMVYESDGVREEIEPLLKRIQRVRDQALEKMEEKADEAKYGELSTAAKEFSKLEQLLTGGATDRVVYEWDNYEE